MYNERIDKITERTDFTSEDPQLDFLKMECANSTNKWVKLWRKDFIEHVYDKEEYQTYLDEITHRETLPEYEEEFFERRIAEVEYRCDLLARKEELLLKYESECGMDV